MPTGNSQQTDVGTTSTEILKVPCNGALVVGIGVRNIGAVAFNSFAIQGRISSAFDWVSLASNSAAFTPDGDGLLPVGFIDYTTGIPTALAGGTQVQMMVLCSGWSELRVLASVASGSTATQSTYSRGA